MAANSFPFLSKDGEDVYFMKGAFEEVIHHCSMYNNGGIPLPLTPQQKSYCQQEEKKMGSLGLRGWCLSLPLTGTWSLPAVSLGCLRVGPWANLPPSRMAGRAGLDSKAQCETSQSG